MKVPMSSVSFRRLVLQLHLWFALVFGLVVSVVCVTGTLSQYRAELVRWANAAPVADTASTADPSATAGALKLRYPELQVAQLVAAAGPGIPDAWFLRPGKPQEHGAATAVTVFTDPGTGAWLGDTAGSTLARFLQSTYLFHHMLWISGWGRWAVGISGLGLVWLCMSGCWLAWPYLGPWWRQGVLNGWSSPGKRWSTWHLRLGLFTVPIVLAVALTGFLNGFIKIWQPLVLAASARPASGDIPPLATRPDWTGIIAQSALALPDTRLYSVQKPKHGDKTPVWKVVRLWPGHLSPRDGAVVELDPATGGIVSVQDPRVLDGGRLLLHQQLGFHVGWFAGPLGRVLWAVVGLVPPFLFVSGVVLWWKKRLTKP